MARIGYFNGQVFQIGSCNVRIVCINSGRIVNDPADAMTAHTELWAKDRQQYDICLRSEPYCDIEHKRNIRLRDRLNC